MLGFFDAPAALAFLGAPLTLRWGRRRFLSALPLGPVASLLPLPRGSGGGERCWLDVCAPFLIEDPARGIRSEIILTSDTFSGARGYEASGAATDYEIFVYDAEGRPARGDGPAQVRVPAMRPAVVRVADLVGDRRFWGSAKIRLRPRGPSPSHASDLFSAAFVRWETGGSFDAVHCNPDPPQTQGTESYHYSMPVPSMDDYECVACLFNPYGERSRGEVALREPGGGRSWSQRYELAPHASRLLRLDIGGWTSDAAAALAGGGPGGAGGRKLAGGQLEIRNDAGSRKLFAYIFIRRGRSARFSVEHPVHQGIVKPRPAAAPFDGGRFKARNVLYSPLLFRGARFGSLALETHLHVGSGLPLDDSLWLYPFATDAGGTVAWSAMTDARLEAQLAGGRFDRGVIRLAAGQSCALDFTGLSLDAPFSGGLSVALSSEVSHTLLKLELRAPEWRAHAFTHFRPGIRAARSYQSPHERGGLATDYIVSGARVVRRGGSLERDALIGVMNIDDRGTDAEPTLEFFGAGGPRAGLSLGRIAPFGCRHYVLSELVAPDADLGPLTLRLVDARAAALMSALHVDYVRRDIALDHGSDRFSTFLDVPCGKGSTS